MIHQVRWVGLKSVSALVIEQFQHFTSDWEIHAMINSCSYTSVKMMIHPQIIRAFRSIGDYGIGLSNLQFGDGIMRVQIMFWKFIRKFIEFKLHISDFHIPRSARVLMLSLLSGRQVDCQEYQQQHT